jgi:hypothetical protein
MSGRESELISQTRRHRGAKLVDGATVSRAASVLLGAFSSRLMVDCEPSGAPIRRSAPPLISGCHWCNVATIMDDIITPKNQTTPGKPYPNTTEAGLMKVNDNAGSQRVAE